MNSPGLTAAKPFRCGAMILAAGASTRMGRPKQLLPINGQPLLVRVVEAALAAPVWPVVVVLGANADQIRPVLAKHPVLVVENEAWAEGMAASIRTGITTLQQFSRALDAALVVLCDQPAFTADTVHRLLGAQAASGCTVVASRYSNRQGAPALFLRDHFATLSGLTGEEGARGLLNGKAAPVASVDLPDLGFDLDTPEDYRKTAEGLT